MNRKRNIPTSKFVAGLVAMVVAATMSGGSRSACAQTANWIWHPDQAQGKVPIGDCYFRKTVEIGKHRSVMLKVAGNDKYEVYLNDKIVAVGESTEIKTFDVSSGVREGQNIIAVKVSNTQGNTAGFAAALLVKDSSNDQWKIFATDSTWKTHTRVISIWKKRVYSDRAWKLAKILEPGKSETRKSTVAKSSTNQLLQPMNVGTVNRLTDEKSEYSEPAISQLDIQFEDPDSSKTESRPTSGRRVSSRNMADDDSPKSVGKLAPREIPSASGQKNGNVPVVTKEDKDRAEIQIGLPELKSLGLVGSSRKNKLAESVFLAKEFEVKQILGGQHGSFIAMSFNEFGQTLLSVEGKGLIMVDFTTTDLSKRVRKVADEVTNIQGILPINGTVFVTGKGDKGAGVYQLIDKDRDGFFETANSVCKFKGPGGEHGAHGLRLGPDGWIYVVLGNACKLDVMAGEKSPYRSSYHGDMKTHYEDPGGHAAGVEAPGGTIIRMTIDGKTVETFAGGIRNAYDFAFNENGDLFLHDSDMEGDVGAPWYRPNQFFHVIAGADLGWRRGWSKWPGYFIDTVPPILGTGNGSPTGATCYRHVTFPTRYQNSIFLADWLNGRISCAKVSRRGASYEAEIEKFFEADGMTITDLEVGPDGSLYFCTGGRGTEGGIFRIQWKGNLPESLTQSQSEVAQIVRMPQIDCAWALQQRALLKQKMGEKWNQALYGIVDETQNKTVYRLNAMNAMLLYGPRPGLEQLQKWSRDDDPEIRRAATSLLTTLPKKLSTDAELKQIRLTLLEQLQDDNAAVRRTACETILRMGTACEVDNLVRILKSEDWAEATAARRVLETIPTKDWRDICFNTPDQKLFCQMATSLLTVEPTKANAYQLMVKISKFSEGQIFDDEFIKMIRVAQLAVLRCDIDPADVPAFAEWVSDEFPTRNESINRELARLSAILKHGDFEQRLVDYLVNSTDSDTTKLSVALHLQTLGDKLSGKERLAIIDWIESQKNIENSGSSYPHYLAIMSRELTRTLSDAEKQTVLENGARWQNAALEVCFTIGSLEDSDVRQLIEIDKALVDKNDSASQQLKLALIALLSESKSDSAMDYLRKIWRRDRDRRSDVVIGLAQEPGGKNWPYLVTSIEQVDDDAAKEILIKLATVDRRPQQAKYYRMVLESGYKLRRDGAFHAIELLKHWAETNLEATDLSWQEKLEKWKTWYEETYPAEEPISIPGEKQIGKWKSTELLDFLDKDKNIGELERGKMIFAKANCADCHRFQGQGEGMGPDLSFVARRFSTRELLESILEPSKHVPDRYAAHQVVTQDGKQYLGIISRDKNGNVVILDSQGKKQKIARDAIDEISPAKVSAMPGNLLDTLSEKDIADLFAFLKSTQRHSRNQETGANWIR